MANRSRLDIMAHILGCCMKPQVKTRVMYDVNITFHQFGTYAALLKSQGLLAHEGNRYIATTKGLQFIRAFTQLQNTMEDTSTLSDRGRRVGVRVVSSLSAK